MKTSRLAVLLALSLPLAGPTSAAAQAARCSGGSGSTDCYLEFDGGSCSGTTLNGKPSIECKDGDSSCDSDGQANRACTFSITACEFQSDVSGCTPQPLKKIKGTKAIKKPPTGVSAPTCASPSTIRVKLGGTKKHPKAGHKKIKVIATASDGTKDQNIFFLVCNPSTTATTMCDQNPAGMPREVDFTTLDHGTDLDSGFSGVSHNFPIIAGAGLKMRLSGCDSTTNPMCKACGETGAGSLNGATFGPPLPLFAAGTPVCVINQFAANTVKGTFDIQQGTFDATATPVTLNSIVFSTSASQVCPRCGNGAVGSTASCDSGPNQNKSCTVEGTVPVRNPSAGINTTYSLSSSCPPGGDEGSRTGSIPISLPITTGTSTITGSKPCPGQPKDDSCGSFSSTCTFDCNGQADVKGGINQWCCSNASHTPCFPTAPNSGEPNHAIVRTGTPVPPTPAFPDPMYPKTATEAVSAASFCIATSGSGVIDQVSGLPGPGAVIFNSTVTVKNQ